MEAMTTIRAFWRLSKMLYSSSTADDSDKPCERKGEVDGANGPEALLGLSCDLLLDATGVLYLSCACVRIPGVLFALFLFST